MADEVHEVLFVLSRDPAANVRHVVPLPGPPAQVVALDGRVFVTVRTLPASSARAAREKIRGPLPLATAIEVTHTAAKTEGGNEARPSPKASESAGPSASTAPSARPIPTGLQRKRNTPAAPFDPAVVRKSQGGLLLAFRPDPSAGLVEIGRTTLAPDAWGLALTPDRKRAVVTSAWAAEVSLVDLEKMLVLGSAKTAREPRGIAITPDGRHAYVSHLVGSSLTKLELGANGITATPLEFPAAPARAPSGRTLTASLGYDLVLSPDATTLFVPRHALGAEGIGTWWGAPSVDALDVATERSIAPSRSAKSQRAHIRIVDSRPPSDWEVLPGRAPAPELSLVQPRAVVYRKSRDTLLVAGEGTDELTELDALAIDPAMAPLRSVRLAPSYDKFGSFPDRGGAPTGIALSRDEATAYVFCQSTFDVVALELATEASTLIHLAEDGLPADAAYGRRLFTNARNTSISGGLGCAACHPEGRDDAYVWRQGAIGGVSEEALPGEGDASNRFVALRENLKFHADPRPTPEERAKLHPRQTPMLAGRVRAMGPFGWRGENPDILTRLINGFRLHRAAWDSAWDVNREAGHHVAKIDYLADYLRSGLLPPPTFDRPLTAEEERGRGIFESDAAMCSRCHVPNAEFTDRQVAPLPPLPVLPGFDREAPQAFKTPSLWFIAGSAPYFHDGSQATLEDLLRTNGNRMGNTSQLTDDDRRALAAYLRVL